MASLLIIILEDVAQYTGATCNNPIMNQQSSFYGAANTTQHIAGTPSDGKWKYVLVIYEINPQSDSYR